MLPKRAQKYIIVGDFLILDILKSMGLLTVINLSAEMLIINNVSKEIEQHSLQWVPQLWEDDSNHFKILINYIESKKDDVTARSFGQIECEDFDQKDHDSLPKKYLTE